MFDINKFLDDREKRVELQNSLLEKFKAPLLTVRANYSGCLLYTSDAADEL